MENFKKTRGLDLLARNYWLEASNFFGIQLGWLLICSGNHRGKVSKIGKKGRVPKNWGLIFFKRLILNFFSFQFQNLVKFGLRKLWEGEGIGLRQTLTKNFQNLGNQKFKVLPFGGLNSKKSLDQGNKKTNQRKFRPTKNFQKGLLLKLRCQIPPKGLLNFFNNLGLAFPLKGTSIRPLCLLNTLVSGV